jgi:secreted trypsin-like serine protease
MTRNILWGLSLTLALSACTPSKQFDITDADSDENTSNIVAGQEVQENSLLAKSVVFLVNSLTKEGCSASLIGGQYALTAAHCLDKEDPKNLYVFFAAKPNRKSERRQVIAMKMSPYWDLRQKEDFNASDIAVIKFEGPALPKGYQAAEFLSEDQKIPKGSIAIVLGYGIKDAHTLVGAGVLRLTALTVSNPDYSPTEILLDQSKGSSVCHGDSGGPAYLYAKDSHGKYKFFLWGVAHGGSLDDVDNKCNKGVIYTNALLYLTWIQNVMKTL